MGRRGHLYCSTHTAMRECDWCGYPRDQRAAACPACFRNRIDAAGLATAQRDVCDWIERNHFPGHALRRISAKLIDAKQFSAGNLGMTKMAVTGGTLFHAEIHLPDGICDEMAREVLAHEYGHVLLHADPSTLDPILASFRHDPDEEGFCEVVRSVWIEHRAAVDSDVRLTAIRSNSFDEYREGFVRMHARYLRLGSLSRLRTTMLSGRTTSARPDVVPVRPSTPSDSQIRPTIVFETHRRPPERSATGDRGPRPVLDLG